MTIEAPKEEEFVAVNLWAVEVAWTGNAAMLSNSLHLPIQNIQLVEVIQPIHSIEPPKNVNVIVEAAERVARPRRRNVSRHL